MKRQWLSEGQYAQLVGLCQFLPGPASSQVGFGIGLSRGGLLGGAAAWVGFTLPSAILLIILASFVGSFTSNWAIAALDGLKITAFVMVAHALWGMIGALTPDKRTGMIGIVGFASALFITGIWGQLAALIIGLALGVVLLRNENSETKDITLPIKLSPMTGMISISIALLLFFGLPLLAAFSQLKLLELADIFYRAGGLVFGGGHVVLPFLEADLVSSGRIDKDVFLSGYGATQAMPGPLFTFAGFLGFLDGHQANFTGALVALVTIFLPGMLLLIGVIPFWARICQNASAAKALAGLNAAVVGILGAAFYDPIFTSAIHSPLHVFTAICGLYLLFKWKMPPIIIVIFLVLSNLVPALI